MCKCFSENLPKIHFALISCFCRARDSLFALCACRIGKRTFSTKICRLTRVFLSSLILGLTPNAMMLVFHNSSTGKCINIDMLVVLLMLCCVGGCDSPICRLGKFKRNLWSALFQHFCDTSSFLPMVEHTAQMSTRDVIPFKLTVARVSLKRPLYG